MNLLQWCTVSWKYIIIDTNWNQIISFRKNVLCNHIAFRFCKARIQSKKIENIWFFRILIDLIFWQILVWSKKFEFAFFASMHVSRIRCIIFFIDFSIISSFSHRNDIFYEFSTIKLHKNSINENAMWNEKLETFVKSMNHKTNRQCVAFSFSFQRQYSNEKYLFHDVFFNQI